MKTEVVPLRVTSGVLKRIEEEEYSLQSIRDGIGLLEEEVKKHRHGKEHSGENLVALALWMNYCQADGRAFEELVERVGKERVEVILKSVVDTNFREFSDHQLVEILNFLELVVSNSQVEVANHWLSKAFSQEIWKHLTKLYLKNLFSTYKKFIREYEALIKHKSSKEDTISAKLLPNILELFGHKFSSLSYDILEPEVKTCEKILEFILVCLSNAQSRLPTLMTLQDKQFYLKNSLFLKYLTALYGEDKKASSLLGNIRQLFRLLKRFVHYDILGESRVARRTLLVHYDTFQEFQRLLFHHFSEKVEHYVIKAVGNTDTREKMAEIFSYLTEADLRLIANKLNIFVPEEDDSDPVLQILTEQKGFKIIVQEILISKLKSRQSFLQEVKSEPLYPTEVELFDRFSNQIANKSQFLDYRQGFAIDRITNSYTNLEDYLFRHFSLWRELFKLETRSEVEDVVSKVNPVFDSITGIVKEFGGWTPNSIETKNFTVYEVAKPKIGSLVADHILAEVNYSTVGINSTVKKDWEKLQHGDVMFLMAFSRQKDGGISNELEETVEIMNQTGLCLVRGCEVVGHLDEERSKIHSSEFRRKVEVKPKGTQRHIQLHLDPNQFARDLTRGSKLARDSMYSLVLKRKSNGPNYIGFLRLILHFLEQNVEIPFWVNLLIVGRPFTAVKDKIANELDKKLTTKGLFSDQSQHKVFTSSQAFKTLSSHFEHEKFHEERSTTRHQLTDEQLEVVTRSLLPGALVVDAPPGSGKSLLSAEIVCQTLLNFPDERIVIVTRSEGELTEVLREIGNTGLVPEDEIMRLGETEEIGSGPDYTRAGRVNYMLKRRLELIEQAEQIAVDLGLPQGTKLTCETAEILYQSQIASRWKDFESKLNAANKSEKLDYPFLSMLARTDSAGAEKLSKAKSKDEIHALSQAHFNALQNLFSEIAKTRVMELLRHNKERAKYLLNYHCRVIIMKASHLFVVYEELLNDKFSVGTLIVQEAGELLDFESFASLAVCKDLKRAIFLGDKNQYTSTFGCETLEKISNLGQSMFTRLQNLGYPTIKLHSQGASRKEIVDLYKSNYPELKSYSGAGNNAKLPGVDKPVQWVDLHSKEHSPIEGQFINLAEAEYAVALFIHLVLSGVPRTEITILASTQAQKDLVEEIVQKKTAWHKALGAPGAISKVDDYRGKKNTVVILSLVRTDPTVAPLNEKQGIQAVSRARSVLFVLGRCPSESYSWLHDLKPTNLHLSHKTIHSLEELQALNASLFQKLHPQQ